MAQSPETKEKIRAVSNKCIEQWKPAAEDLARFRNADFANHDNKMHCFAHCALTDLGFWLNGKPDEAKVAQVLNPLFGEESVVSTGAKCNSAKGANDCETSFKVYQCYREAKVAVEI
uniref:Odorant binding protein 4 n=1 Tax=Liriomyza sativae TaxID=127406 RepID=A0A0X8B1Q7_LIRSA|nr:odorant binding protein 4 [Liriomyza sativae]